MRRLLDLGVDVDARDHEKDTPLHDNKTMPVKQDAYVAKFTPNCTAVVFERGPKTIDPTNDWKSLPNSRTPRAWKTNKEKRP